MTCSHESFTYNKSVYYTCTRVPFQTFSWYTALGFMGFVFFTLFTIGSTFDQRWWAPILEGIRCIVTVSIIKDMPIFGHFYLDKGILCYFVISTLIQSSISLTLIKNQLSGDKPIKQN